MVRSHSYCPEIFLVIFSVLLKMYIYIPIYQRDIFILKKKRVIFWCATVAVSGLASISPVAIFVSNTNSSLCDRAGNIQLPIDQSDVQING